jgi:hypothetical protein
VKVPVILKNLFWFNLRAIGGLFQLLNVLLGAVVVSDCDSFVVLGHSSFTISLINFRPFLVSAVFFIYTVFLNENAILSFLSSCILWSCGESLPTNLVCFLTFALYDDLGKFLSLFLLREDLPMNSHLPLKLWLQVLWMITEPQGW